jgi:hypothetical protein
LVSAIEVVDAIFGAGKTRFKTVLGGRLRLNSATVRLTLPGQCRPSSAC